MTGAGTGAVALMTRGELADAAGFAAKALPRRPVVPVLGGMRVEVTAGRVTFAVFDYEVAVRSAAHAETDGTGSVLVDGRDLAAAVKALPKAKTLPASLEAGESGIVIGCGGVRMTVPAMGPDAESEYPALPPMPPAAGIADSAGFAKSVLRVAACAGTDDTLPMLLCVHLEFTAEAVTLAATDRYRLAVDKLQWTAGDAGDSKALVPAYALVMFAKACAREGKVTIAAGSDAGQARAGFSDGTRELIVSQASGEFVRYRQLLRAADADATAVTADAGQLAAAVTRAGKVCGKNEPIVFAAGSGTITVTAQRDGKAAASQSVPCMLEGDPITTGFNAGYLASVLGGITGQARIGFASPNKVALVRGDGFTAACMPIKLGG